MMQNLFSIQQTMLNMSMMSSAAQQNNNGIMLEQFSRNDNNTSTLSPPAPLSPLTTAAVPPLVHDDAAFGFVVPTLTTALVGLAVEHGQAAGVALQGNLHHHQQNQPAIQQLPQQQRLAPFELIIGTMTYLVIIGITILGNTLVILAVFNYRPLKKVQNYFIVSLAASDMLVALLVMPLHVVKFLANGQWLLGVTVCQLFTTADILLCTSSILNLCAIAIDRYWAIHDPIAYAQKRSLKLVGGMIITVWVASAVISVPPLIGWNDWTSQQLVDHCELTSQKAFVVFSACGSFFLPLLVMVIVYMKIFLNARKRIRKNRGRSALFKMSSELADHKHKRTHRIPVAATSVIALASATGAQILRKRTLPRASLSTDDGGVVVNREEVVGGACTKTMDGACTLASCCNAQQPLYVPKLLPDMDNAILGREQQQQTEMDGDSGHGGSSKDSPENTVAAVLQSKMASSTIITTVPHLCHSSQQLHNHHLHQHPTLTKRHSFVPTAPSSMVALTSSASMMAMATSSDGTENGGAQVAASHKVTMALTPQTVELKTHLKEREKISVAKEKRAAKTIAVIIFVFTFCWLPFFCAYVIMPFCPQCYLHPKVHQAFVWLGYINSSLNPFLYGILNLEFRRAFRKILCPRRVQNAQRRRLSEQASVRKKSAPKS